MYVSGAFFSPPRLFLVTKHKGTEKRESPSPAPKPRKVELSESGTCFVFVLFFKLNLILVKD